MTTVPVKCAHCTTVFHLSPMLAMYVDELVCAACQKKKTPQMEWPLDLILKHSKIKPNKQEN